MSRSKELLRKESSSQIGDIAINAKDGGQVLLPTQVAGALKVKRQEQINKVLS